MGFNSAFKGLNFVVGKRQLPWAGGRQTDRQPKRAQCCFVFC